MNMYTLCHSLTEMVSDVVGTYISAATLAEAIKVVPLVDATFYKNV